MRKLLKIILKPGWLLLKKLLLLCKVSPERISALREMIRRMIHFQTRKSNLPCKPADSETWTIEHDLSLSARRDEVWSMLDVTYRGSLR